MGELLITIAGDESAVQASSVNWGTIIANASALGLLAHSHVLEAAWLKFVGPQPLVNTETAWLLSVFLAKFRGSFCGALSAYGAFSEDVASSLAEGNVDAAAANIGMNAVTMLVFSAFMTHWSCAFEVPELSWS